MRVKEAAYSDRPKSETSILVKMTDSEKEQIQGLADKYTKGNKSMLLRIAVREFKATKASK